MRPGSHGAGSHAGHRRGVCVRLGDRDDVGHRLGLAPGQGTEHRPQPLPLTCRQSGRVVCWAQSCLSAVPGGLYPGDPGLAPGSQAVVGASKCRSPSGRGILGVLPTDRVACGFGKRGRGAGLSAVCAHACHRLSRGASGAICIWVMTRDSCSAGKGWGVGGPGALTCCWGAFPCLLLPRPRPPGPLSEHKAAHQRAWPLCPVAGLCLPSSLRLASWCLRVSDWVETSATCPSIAPGGPCHRRSRSLRMAPAPSPPGRPRSLEVFHPSFVAHPMWRYFPGCSMGRVRSFSQQCCMDGRGFGLYVVQ